MKEQVAVYPGSFDPITVGHVDVIVRASRLFPKVVVAVYTGAEINYQWSADQRLAMAKKACANFSGVSIVPFQGLLAHWMKQQGYHCIVRGIRDGDDMSQEWRMAHSNQALNQSIETVFLPASPSVSYVSSTLVRQVMAAGGDPSPFMPEALVDMIQG